MRPYLSPTRYLAGGYGLDTSSFSRAQIMRFLSRATAQVNAWCAVPQIPQPFDFRGGAVTGEQHEWRVPSSILLADASTRRVYLNQGPVRTVTAFLVRLGKTYSIELTPSTDIYVNPMAGYIEVVAVAPTIVGSWPVGINFGLWSPVSETSYTYGRIYPVVDDILEAESPSLYVGSQGSWDTSYDVTVEVNGVEIDAGDYAVNYPDGTITFDASAEPAADTEVTASYTSNIPPSIEEATGLIATAMMGESRVAARGLLGLSSIKVAEVTLTAMSPAAMVTNKSGISIPTGAANLLYPYVMGSVA